VQATGVSDWLGFKLYLFYFCTTPSVMCVTVTNKIGLLNLDSPQSDPCASKKLHDWSFAPEINLPTSLIFMSFFVQMPSILRSGRVRAHLKVGGH